MSEKYPKLSCCFIPQMAVKRLETCGSRVVWYLIFKFALLLQKVIFYGDHPALKLKATKEVTGLPTSIEHPIERLKRTNQTHYKRDK